MSLSGISPRRWPLLRQFPESSTRRRYSSWTESDWSGIDSLLSAQPVIPWRGISRECLVLGLRKGERIRGQACHPGFGPARLVRCNTDYDVFADGACEARSRQEEEDDAWPSSTTTNAEIVRNPHLPSGWRRDTPISLSLLLHYRKTWRSFVASRTRPVALATNTS